jgi:N-carbamoyl-L-amino-acid hydrolase
LWREQLGARVERTVRPAISHNEIEEVKPEHITAEFSLLSHAMLVRAKVV